MEKKTLTIKEAANILNVSPQTMYKISHQDGFYPLLKLGRSRKILTHLLDKWMEENAGQMQE